MKILIATFNRGKFRNIKKKQFIKCYDSYKRGAATQSPERLAEPIFRTSKNGGDAPKNESVFG
jgi:hypothetical protein